MVQDDRFRWLTHIDAPTSNEAETPARTRLTQQYLALPCGLIKGRVLCFDGGSDWRRFVQGALKHLGVNCVVTADAVTVPKCGRQSLL